MKPRDTTRTLSIITYHYVRDLAHSRYPEIKGLSVDLFKEQLLYILKHHHVIKMQDLFEAVVTQKELPKNSLLLTFDDGYADHFQSVFPILDELGMQGSFFPAGKAIQENRVLDVNKIHFILASVENKKQLITDIYSQMDSHRDEFNLEPNEYYYNALAIDGRFDMKEVVFIKKLLQKALPERLRSRIVNDLFSRYVSREEEVFSRELYMNADQLKCMIRHGMYVGSHGWDHYWLDTLTEEKQRREVELSANFLKMLGCDTSQWAMCYPYGAYNNSLVGALKEYGCTVAFSTGVGVANLATADVFALPRLDTNDLPKDRNAGRIE